MTAWVIRTTSVLMAVRAEICRIASCAFALFIVFGGRLLAVLRLSARLAIRLNQFVHIVLFSVFVCTNSNTHELICAYSVWVICVFMVVLVVFMFTVECGVGGCNVR